MKNEMAKEGFPDSGCGVEAVGLEPTLHYALIYSQLPSQFGHTSIPPTRGGLQMN